MTEEQAVELITKRWRDAFDALNPIDDIGVVPYTFDGETVGTSDYWARVTIRHSSSRQITMGAAGTRKVERRGTIFVQLFGATRQGRKQISKLVDITRQVFELQSLSLDPDDDPVSIYEGLAPEVEADGRWSRTSVSFPFDWYETR